MVVVVVMVVVILSVIKAGISVVFAGFVFVLVLWNTN